MGLTLGFLTLMCGFFASCSEKKSTSHHEKVNSQDLVVNTRFLRGINDRFADDDVVLRWSVKVTKGEIALLEKNQVPVEEVEKIFKEMKLKESDVLNVTLSAEGQEDYVFSNSAELAQKNPSSLEVWKTHCEGGRVGNELSQAKSLKVCILKRGVIEGLAITALQLAPHQLGDLR